MADSERIPVGPVKGPVIANVAAVMGAFVFAVLTAMQLPARYPTHFNTAGQPDRWAEAGGFGWYALPLLSAGLAAAMVALALLLPRIPMSLVNIPRKDQFLRLSLAEQTPIIQQLIRFLLWISLADTLLFTAIHWMMYRAAVAARVGDAWIILVVVSVGYFVLMIWGIVVNYRLVRDATNRLGVEPPS